MNQIHITLALSWRQDPKYNIYNLYNTATFPKGLSLGVTAKFVDVLLKNIREFFHNFYLITLGLTRYSICLFTLKLICFIKSFFIFDRSSSWIYFSLQEENKKLLLAL